MVLGLFWMGRDLWERPAGRPSRPPSRTTPGGVGSACRLQNILLVLVCCQFILFRKRLFIIIVTNFYFKERNQFFPSYLVE